MMAESELRGKETFLAIVATVVLLLLTAATINGTITHPITFGFSILFTALATFGANYLVSRGILPKNMLLFYFLIVAGLLLIFVGAAQKGYLPLAYPAPQEEAALGTALFYTAILLSVGFFIAMVLQKRKLQLPFYRGSIAETHRRFVKKRQ